MKILLPALLLLMTLPLYSQNSGTLTGTVQHTDGRLFGVNIQVHKTLLGCSTDKAGHYYLKIPSGTWLVEYRMIGYTPVTDSVKILPGETVEKNVTLQSAPIPFKGIVVEAPRYEPEQLTRSFQISTTGIRNVPPLGEPDLLQAVAALPGVSVANDLKGALHFRGGSSDQNLILLDGVEIYHPQHLLGLLGAFNTLIIETAEIFNGYLPVKYGDRISGIIDVKTIEDRNVSQAHLSLLSSGFCLAREFWKTHFLIAARKTYLNLLIPDLNYGFTDLNLKISRKLGSHFKVNFYGYLNQDNLKPDKAEATGVDQWGNAISALKFSYHSRSVFNKAQISYAHNLIKFPADPRIKNIIEDFTFSDILLFLWKNHETELGFSYKSLVFDYLWHGKYNDLKEIFHENIPNQFDWEKQHSLANVFLSDKVKLLHPLQIEYGFRYNRWRQADYFSPRIAALLTLSPIVSLKASLGQYRQFLAQGKEPIEGSVWGLLFPAQNPTTANGVTLGFALKLPGEITFEGEGYLKKVKHFSWLDQNFPEFESATGKIHGADFLLRKNQGTITFQLAYNYLKTTASVQGKEFPFDWDIPHSLNGLLGYELTKGWFFNTHLTYHSGAPITPVTGKYLRVLSVWERQPYYIHQTEFLDGETNSFRLPAYFRLDVSLRKKIVREKFSYIFYLQVINLLNNHNALRFDWDEYYSTYSINAEGKKVYGTGAVNALPILPSVGVEFEF